MRSSASTLAVLAALAGCSSGGNEISRPPLAAPPSVTPAASAPLPPEAGTPDGPSGTSGQGAARYDQVGYASWYGEELGGAPTASGAAFAPDAITAAHRSLPLGSHAEVTALDTGRTILVLVNDRGPGRADREIDLSRGAAALLGMNGRPTAPVRVRGVVAAPGDAAALAAGRPAAPRLDAPPALLAGLRNRLTPPAAPVTAQPNRPAKPARQRPAATAPRARAPVAGKGYVVQIAAFSSEPRARSLAATLGGYVEAVGSLHRVRLGPFADSASAERARDGAARRGYGDSTIIVQP